MQKGSNNFAEFQALKLLLKCAKDWNLSSLQDFGDSSLVKNWIRGRSSAQCKSQANGWFTVGGSRLFWASLLLRSLENCTRMLKPDTDPRVGRIGYRPYNMNKLLRVSLSFPCQLYELVWIRSFLVFLLWFYTCITSVCLLGKNMVFENGYDLFLWDGDVYNLAFRPLFRWAKCSCYGRKNKICKFCILFGIRSM